MLAVFGLQLKMKANVSSDDTQNSMLATLSVLDLKADINC